MSRCDYASDLADGRDDYRTTYSKQLDVVLRRPLHANISQMEANTPKKPSYNCTWTRRQANIIVIRTSESYPYVMLYSTKH